MNEKKNINEVLKRLENEQNQHDDGTMHLDDTERVKVLSPGRLVLKRFLRNKLAIIGSAILAFMFVFCFIGPLFYPYGQTEKFYKTDILENFEFAAAKEITEYGGYKLTDDADVHYSVINRVNMNIIDGQTGTDAERVLTDSESGKKYFLENRGEKAYTLSALDAVTFGTLVLTRDIGIYDSVAEIMNYSENESGDEAFFDAIKAGVSTVRKSDTFEHDGVVYQIISQGLKKYLIRCASDPELKPTDGSVPDAELVALIADKAPSAPCLANYNGTKYFISNNGDQSYSVETVTKGAELYLYTRYIIDRTDEGAAPTPEFVVSAVVGTYSGGTFSFDGVSYTVENDGDGVPIISVADNGTQIGYLSTFSVSRINGSGALPIAFKNDIRDAIEDMLANTIREKTIITTVELQNDDGSTTVDDNGNVIYDDNTEVTIIRKSENFAISCDRMRYLIDSYATPMNEKSDEFHIIGTDGDGYDILSRMMYGGRVSLVVGFVVVIIEVILGVIMGGISGYFGGWVDTLIMRIVDVFYCIPSMPILIILGSFFDAAQLDPYVRLIWLMAVLGFLGWAGVARLVRGQILSLREQEFMLATEVTGLRVSRRIFRHLIPNVMPQLIVTATAGLGGVILTESTLSFLGLGVKHPLATWGTMINSVSDYSAMVNYTYIWVPVGLLICLTVIAFNFVGDGLRDAFDPKMKR